MKKYNCDNSFLFYGCKFFMNFVNITDGQSEKDKTNRKRMKKVYFLPRR
jgi:hypothetical protein